MIVPQFSLRTLLVGTAAAGIAAWVVYQALTGVVWAQGATIGLATLALMMALHFLIFLFCFAVASSVNWVFVASRPVATQNPFATSEPPVQVIDPNAS